MQVLSYTFQICHDFGLLKKAFANGFAFGRNPAMHWQKLLCKKVGEPMS